MIKRIIALVMCALALLQVPVFAQSEIVYGDTIQLLRMSEEFSSGAYWNMYRGREACEFSTDKYYRGGRSLKINVPKLESAFMFGTQFVKPSMYDADNGALYFEWYVYGISTDVFAGRVKFSSAYKYADGTEKAIRTGMNYELADKAGWVKIWTTVPKSAYGKIESCNMGIHYDPDTAGMKEVDCFYIDEFAIKRVPDSLEIQDIYAEDEVDLNLVRVFGKDVDGKKELITTKSYFNWAVISGDAMVDDGILKYDGIESGDVVVRCEYFGITTEFTVSFKCEPKVSYSKLEVKEDNSIAVTVYNNVSKNISSNLVFALFDGERLYSVQTVKAEVDALKSVAVTSKPIRVSANIANPKIMVYVWDSLGGMCELE